jgi:hypothetical protein
MSGRDTGFDAGGVGLRPSVGDAFGGLVRPLGAFERMFYLIEQKSTKHFCVVAELADNVDPFALAGALLAVQRRHPLLNVYVEDHPQTRLGFYRPASVPPIPVTVVDAETGHTWRDLVAEELTRPFDRSWAPMIRVVLLCSGPRTPAAIVLTADHAIVDGLSAAYLLRDLFSALNGHDLTALPVPPAQGDLIGALRDGHPAAAVAVNNAPPPAQPDWLATPSTIRPLDGAVPHLSAASLNEDLTWRLITRARAERTTGHSALVSAMSQVIIASGRNEFVRVLTPIDIRTHLGVGDDICLYISAAPAPRSSAKSSPSCGTWRARSATDSPVHDRYLLCWPRRLPPKSSSPTMRPPRTRKTSWLAGSASRRSRPTSVSWTWAHHWSCGRWRSGDRRYSARSKGS